MQADWEVEVGGEAAVIDALWPGFVDLRVTPERAHDLSEAKVLPALADALAQLNAPASPVWTSKCDVWSVSQREIDRFELDAPSENATRAQACYIDLLPASESWNSPEDAVAFCRELTHRLHAAPISSCRVDLMVRSAVAALGSSSTGITGYLTACGPTEARALEQLCRALAAFVDAVVLPLPPAEVQ